MSIKKERPKALYTFVKDFKTSKRAFKKGSDCFETNKKVLEYLTTNKIIIKK